MPSRAYDAGPAPFRAADGAEAAREDAGAAPRRADAASSLGDGNAAPRPMVDVAADAGVLDGAAPTTSAGSASLMKAPQSASSAALATTATTRAAAQLLQAEEAMATLEYLRARQLAEQAIAHGGLAVDELTRAYTVIAVALAQLDEAEAAKRACLRLFALSPTSNIAMRLSPSRRTPVLDARGFWSVHPNGFALEVNYARRSRQVMVRVHDAIRWVRTVHVWTRFGDREFVKQEQAAAPSLAFDVVDVQAADTLELVVFAVDEHGNVLLQVGREHDPKLFAPSEAELAAVLRRDIRGGQTGSFARRLEELGVDVAVHGYLSLELKPEGAKKITTFDLHHATTMIRATLGPLVSVEVALEWEHIGRTQSDFYLPHAFLDLKARDYLILRGGFFEAPVGAFNEYLYPDFLRITGLPPLFSRTIVPALWSEVGLQVRGRFELARSSYLTYAAFVSNGLEQPDAMPTDGMVAEGGDLRAMRFHAREQFASDKAVGGRLGVELGDFDLGVSAYTGRYTIERDRRLTIGDADLSYRTAWFTLRSEGAFALQETTERLLRKHGVYVLLAFRPIAHLEPYFQYDFIKLDARLQRGLLGCAVYPLPNGRATNRLRLKSEVGYEFPQDKEKVLVWFFQLTTGF